MSDVNIARDSVAQAADILALEIATGPDDGTKALRERADALSVVAAALASVAWGPQGGQRLDETLATYDYKATERSPFGFGG